MSDRNLIQTSKALSQVIARLQNDVRALKTRAKLAGTGKEATAAVDPLAITANDPEVELVAATIESGRWLLLGRADWRARHDTGTDAFTGLERITVRLLTHPIDDPSEETVRDTAYWSPQATEIGAPAATVYVGQPFSLAGLVRLDERRRVRLLAQVLNSSNTASEWLRMKIICVPL